MGNIKLTCIECPIGCEMIANKDGEKIIVSGNSCPRGELYAKNEVVCPKRVLTTTVKTSDGRLLPVKTDLPIRKDMQFDVMKKISNITANTPIKIGEIIVKNILDDANLVATDNMD